MIHKPGIPESRQTYISDILQYATWKKTTADEIDCWKNTTNHRRQMKCETAKRGAVTAYYDGTCW